MIIDSMYHFCPHCASPQIRRTHRQYFCTSCQFVWYIDPAPCNAVIIHNKKREIVLVKRKYPPKRGQWDVPGGFIEPGETAEESIIREMKEELHADIKELHYLTTATDMYTYKGTTKYTFGIIFTATIISPVLTANDDISVAEWVPTKEVLKRKIAFNSVRKALQDFVHSLSSH